MGIKEMAKILPGTVIIFAVLWLTAHSSPLESNSYFDNSSNNASDSTSTAEESNRLSLPRGSRRTAWSKEENGNLKSDAVKNEQFAGQKKSSRIEEWRLKKLVDYIISVLTKGEDANNFLNNLREKKKLMNANQTENSKNKSNVSSPTFNDNNPKTNSIALANNNNSNMLKNDGVSNGANDTDSDSSVNNHKGDGKNEGKDGNDISTVENVSSEQNQKSQNGENNDKKTSSSMNVASGKYRNYNNEGNDDDRANKHDKEAQPPDDNNSNLKHPQKDQKEFISTSDVPQDSENEFISRRSQPSSSVQNDIFTTKSEPSNSSQGNFQNAQLKSLQNAQNDLSNSRSPSLQNDENKYISKESQLFSDNSTKIVPKMSQKSNSQKLQNSTRSNLSQEQQKESESYPSSDFSAYDGIDSSNESVSSEESNTSRECDDFDSDFDNSNEYNLEADETILQKTPGEMENANVKSVASDKLFNRSENKQLSFTTSIKNSASLQQAHISQNNDKTRQSIKNAPNQTPSKQEEIVSDSKDSKENSAGVANRKEKTQSLYKNKILRNEENTTKSIKISENKSKEPFQQEQMQADRNSEDTAVDVENKKENTQSPKQNKELQNINYTPKATDTAENKDEEPSQDKQILIDNKQTEENKLYSVNENESTQTLQQSQIINYNIESIETSKNNGKASFHEEQILAEKNSEDTPVDAEKEKENAQSLQQNKLLLNINNTPEGTDNDENKDKERSQGEQILTDNKQTEESTPDSVNENENTQSLQQDEVQQNRKDSVGFPKFSENKDKDTFQQHEALTSREHLDDTSNVVANKKENTQSLQQNEINQKIDNTVETIFTVENKGIESSQQEQMLTDRNSINTSVDAENDKEERRHPQQDETFVNKINSTSSDSFSLKVNNEQSLEPENTKITDHVYDSPTNFVTDDMKYLASIQTSSGTTDNTKSSTNYKKEKEVSNTLKQNESITNSIYDFDSPSNYKNKIETETVVDNNFNKAFLRPSYSRQLPNFSVNNDSAKSLTSEETYDTMVKSRVNNINGFNSLSDYKNQTESETVHDVDSKRTFLNPTNSHESPAIAVNNGNIKPSKKTYDTILEYMYEHSNSPLFKAMRKENSRNQRNDFAYQQITQE